MKVKVICGDVKGVKGPVQDIVIDPEYLDVTVPSKAKFTHASRQGHTVFAYVVEGQGTLTGTGFVCLRGGRGQLFRFQERVSRQPENLLMFGDGDESDYFHAGRRGEVSPRFRKARLESRWPGMVRFVMNTQEELRIAFEEYEQGTFVKHRP